MTEEEIKTLIIADLNGEKESKEAEGTGEETDITGKNTIMLSKPH